MTTSLYQNSAQAIRRSAPDQTFPQKNNAFYVTDVTVPKDLLEYVGLVAPIYQGILTPRDTLYPGLGPRDPTLRLQGPRRRVCQPADYGDLSLTGGDGSTEARCPPPEGPRRGTASFGESRSRAASLNPEDVRPLKAQRGATPEITRRLGVGRTWVRRNLAAG